MFKFHSVTESEKASVKDKFFSAWPRDRDLNASFEIMYRCIEANGWRYVGLRESLLGRGKAPGVVVFNFFEEVKGTGLCVLLDYIKRRSLLCLCRFRGCSVIHVVHNVVPHETGGALASSLFLRLRKALCRKSAAIVVMCDDTREALRTQLGDMLYAKVEGKVRKISHPSYASVYADVPSVRARLGISEDMFLLLTLGLIRPYKNIELIAEVAEHLSGELPEATFVVAGKCMDEAYLRDLEALCENASNVRLVPEFVPDDEVVGWVRACDIMLLPLETGSMLNSGSCMLAFSFGRTVVCPEIGTIHEFPSELTYSYTYKSREEHVRQVEGQIRAAYADWRRDGRSFARKGEALREILEESASENSLVRAYGTLLNDVFR